MWSGNGMGACGYLGGGSICWGQQNCRSRQSVYAKIIVKIIMILSKLTIRSQIIST